MVPSHGGCYASEPSLRKVHEEVSRDPRHMVCTDGGLVVLVRVVIVIIKDLVAVGIGVVSKLALVVAFCLHCAMHRTR